jgi:chemotaxis signal transduction protein
MTPESPRDGAGACRACLVAVEERVLAVEVGVAREVLVLEAHTRVPGAPPHVLGVVNRRGTVLAILDLRPLLGLASRPIERGARALVVQADEVQVGLLVDRVLGLETFDSPGPPAAGGPDGAALRSRGLLPRRPGEPPALLLDVPAVLDALRIGRALGPPAAAAVRSPAPRAEAAASRDARRDEGDPR